MILSGSHRTARGKIKKMKIMTAPLLASMNTVEIRLEKECIKWTRGERGSDT